MLRPNMSLHIGYVNVQGLSLASWKAYYLFLDYRFDYLFVAKTWFKDYKSYSRYRRFIALTHSTSKNLLGRQGGGIYLLGSHRAQSKVERVEVTKHTITFHRGKHSFTRVYFPLKSLDIQTLISYLDSL